MFFLVELWTQTLCAEFVIAKRHLLSCCILWRISQIMSGLIIKISQPRVWISLKSTSVTPQSNSNVFPATHLMHLNNTNHLIAIISQTPKQYRSFKSLDPRIMNVKYERLVYMAPYEGTKSKYNRKIISFPPEKPICKMKFCTIKKKFGLPSYLKSSHIDMFIKKSY